MDNFKILIVEDDALVAEDIKLILQNSRHSVTSIATSGQEALIKAKKDSPDLVLMDIVLEGKMDGIE
ncbi:MAG: response regulator, partial [Candidatus Helarchaeota archaeon]